MILFNSNGFSLTVIWLQIFITLIIIFNIDNFIADIYIVSSIGI